MPLHLSLDDKTLFLICCCHLDKRLILSVSGVDICGEVFTVDLLYSQRRLHKYRQWSLATSLLYIRI